MSRRTLVIAPHPDDETLGCGGTLLRRKNEGYSVAWVIVTRMTELAGWSNEQISRRDLEIAKVAKLIGFDEVFNLQLSTTRLDALPLADVVSALSTVFKKFAPSEVMVPHRSDVHSDHRVTHDAVAACVKWFRYPSVCRLLAYETPSETEFSRQSECAFRPNFFVDIGDYLERKLEILKIYSSELGEFPFPRSLKAVRSLAEWRGASCGYMAAEAFELMLQRQ